MSTIIERMKSKPLSFEPKPEPPVPTIAELTKMMTELMALYKATLLAIQKTPSKATVNPSEVTVSSPIAEIRKSLGITEPPTGRVYDDHQLILGKVYEQINSDPLLRELQNCVQRSAELEHRYEQLEKMAATPTNSPVTRKMIDQAIIRFENDVLQQKSDLMMVQSEMMLKADAETSGQYSEHRYFEPKVYKVLQSLSKDLESLDLNAKYSALAFGSAGVSDIVDTLMDGVTKAPITPKLVSREKSACITVEELEAALKSTQEKMAEVRSVTKSLSR